MTADASEDTRDAGILAEISAPPAFSHTCGARWTGLLAAHCAPCHRTFGGVAGFEKHRKGGTCLDPATLGMVERDGIWRRPPDPRALARLKALRERS